MVSKRRFLFDRKTSSQTSKSGYVSVQFRLSFNVWPAFSSIMSSLRRRLLGDSSSPSRTPSPVKGEPVSVIPTAHLKKLTQKRSKRRQSLVFGLGGLFGIIIALFFAQRHDVINFEGLMDLNLDSLIDAIPAGIVRDARDITVSRPLKTRDLPVLTKADRCRDLEA